MVRIVSRIPQQNSVAERMNMTINEYARSMRIHARLPTVFCVDAINTAIYLINTNYLRRFGAIKR